MKQWEYKYIYIHENDIDVISVLNKAGAEGWEIIEDASDDGLAYLAKRELKEK